MKGEMGGERGRNGRGSRRVKRARMNWGFGREKE